MYECVICYSVNHGSRLNCQNCGTMPARYTLIGMPARFSSSGFGYVPVSRAIGACSAEDSLKSKIGLRTVTLTYYAEAE